MRTPVFSLLAAMMLSVPLHSVAQKNWHLLSPEKDKVYGAAVIDAYKKLGDKKPTPVIVAVIDIGTDINHDALKSHIWTNKGEIAGNGIDDDKNGYADDVHGWSFLGGKGGDINYEAVEETRTYFNERDKYVNVDTAGLDSAGMKDYRRFKSMERRYIYDQQRRQSAAARAAHTKERYDNSGFMRGLARLMQGKNVMKDLQAYVDATVVDAKINAVNVDSVRHAVVGDDPKNATERYYGSNNVIGPEAGHGTHTAGIIASIAKESADKGSWLQLMPIRAVPNGDERDKDVANAIRYAVDNGARVVNMSFGKYSSPDKAVVDAAVRYAMEKDVLLVVGSGNDGMFIDSMFRYNFPNPVLDTVNFTKADNWIEVGANAKKTKRLAAMFSNYGSKSVDLFAPGVDVYATMPNNTYGWQSGTSMAAPVVAGVAAMLRSYYPQLSAVEIKDLLLKSVTKYDGEIPKPGTQKTPTYLKDLCRTGGIVNAAKAVELAGK